MKNVCYIISGIDKALAFEWICENLSKEKYKLHFVLLHDRKGDLEKYFENNKVPYLRIHYNSKIHLLNAGRQIFLYLKKEKIDIIHCHLLDAGLAGITAGKLLGIKNRIYTRHYSTYHHVYYPKGILYDKLINVFSTKIVAVSKVVQNVLTLKEGVQESKTSIIHHGFPLEMFEVLHDKNVELLKEKYLLKDNYPVIGVISRYTEWKGIQYIIPAFKKILSEFPQAKLVLANAKGEFRKTIHNLLSTLPSESYVEIEFENDLFSLYHTFDVFVHVPVDEHSEAFGQVYIEAMAAGKPCIFTKSGIGNEIIENEVNALVVPYQNSEKIYEKIKLILTSSEISEGLGLKAIDTVQDKFKLSGMISALEKLYE